MRTSNPVLSDDALARAARQLGGDTQVGADPTAPLHTEGRFTVIGTIQRVAILFTLVLAGGAVGWGTVDVVDGAVVGFPTWIMPVGLALFGLAMFTFFKPAVAKYTAPLWAVAEGVLLGAISRVYETQFDGIVGQAVVGTMAVAFLTLGAYRVEILRVTPRFRRNVFVATAAVAVVYVVNIVMRMFGGDGIGFIHDSGPLGIGISLFVIGLAAMNLAVDFDLMERGERERWPADMMWVGAFGLLVTLVWLYIEVLRLLAKLRD